MTAFLRPWLEFLRSYTIGLFVGWFGVVFAVVGLVRLIEWFRGKPFQFLSTRRKVGLLVICLFAAQFFEARSLSDQLRQAQQRREEQAEGLRQSAGAERERLLQQGRAERAILLKDVEREIANRDRVVQDKEREIRRLEGEKASLERQLDERARRREIREQLGGFLDEGLRVLTRCVGSGPPFDLKEAEAWALRVEEFLRARAGQSYVARFRERRRPTAV